MLVDYDSEKKSCITTRKPQAVTGKSVPPQACILYFSSLGGAYFSRLHVHASIFSLPVEDVDDKSQRTYNKQGIKRGIDCLSQSEKHLNQSKDRKSTRLNSSHVAISYAVFCLKKKTRPTR